MLLNITRPYLKVTFEFLVNELLMPYHEVEELLVEMILDKRLFGSIDQLNGCLILNRVGQEFTNESRVVERLTKLAENLTTTTEQLCINTHN